MTKSGSPVGLPQLEVLVASAAVSVMKRVARFRISSFQTLGLSLGIVVTALALYAVSVRAEVVWVEGENPAKADIQRHPWWYDKVNKDLLSGGDFISNWGAKAGKLQYSVSVLQPGEYDFWVRANPFAAKLSYQINSGGPAEINLNTDQRENVNIANDGKTDMRFLAWVHVGKVALTRGPNSVAFAMHSDNNNHGMLDCFVFSNEGFEPRGLTKPGNVSRVSEADKGWFPFEPGEDAFGPASAFDLRSLNEDSAGDGGFIAVKDGQFVHSKSGAPVRFWAVNGPPDSMKDPAQLRNCARMLVKHGVNLIRIHAPYFNNDGEISPVKVQRAMQIVEAMKSQGIYTDFSVYWYSFLQPGPNTTWLRGYDGKQNPFAALIFNADFQKKYEQWWTTLLTTRSRTTHLRLIDEPACASLELQNEDSLFFWTFSDKNIPDAQMRIIEKLFGDWAEKKYGSLNAALTHWQGTNVGRDDTAEGRLGFRPLWNIFNDRTARDKDTAAFMTELQRAFYQKEYAFLRSVGFKGLITTTAWTTASPQYLGPLDKYTNTVGDYIDRHGYFSGDRHGPNDSWTLLNTQVYSDRSALRFDPSQPGKAKLFVNPVMDPHYDNKPSVISETSFDRPNRYRSEAPLYDACYGALQGSNAFVFFALDTDHWAVKPGYFMQPWTLTSPAIFAQFPAAALIFRQALISPGDVLVDLNLNVRDLENLQGTPMPQDASFDELRSKDIPKGIELKAGSVIDPLVHYAGRTSVAFSDTGAAPKLVDLAHYIDHGARTVSSTNHQLKLDYEKGLLIINAPAVQGASGALKDAGMVETADLSIHSNLELGHIVVVALDGKPLVTSSKMLLQVMSEERPSGFRAEDAGAGRWRITDVGHDPWLVRKLTGTVRLKRADAAALKVTRLDFNGYPSQAAGHAAEIELNAKTVYYVIAR